MDKNKVLYLNNTFTTKSDDESEDSIYIEGYANTTDVDRSDDVIISNAWLKGMENYQKNPIILAYHNHDAPVGRMEDHKVNAKGLWIRARISAAAGEVYKLIKDGILTAFSVGFRILDAEFDNINGLFIIKELELMEISVVSVPCNQESIFSLAKSFESEAEFNTFKSQYIVSKANTTPINTKKEFLNMDEKELAALLAKTVDNALAKDKAAREEADAIKAAKAKEAAEVEARIQEAVAKATAGLVTATTISSGDTGAEKLLADVEARFAKQSEETKSVLEGLQAAIAEKASELDAVMKSKMRFTDGKQEEPVSKSEKETAVLIKTIMGKAEIKDTKVGASLLEKAGAHVPGAVPWELEVSLNMEQEIRQKLIISSLLKQIAMQTNVMKMPLNPATGLGTWVTNAQFGTADSSGAAQTHQLSEITLSAYKVATKEYMAYEEEEDSLIILLPIIRDAMIRRVARSVDQAFLRGAGTGADPVKGLATYATANTAVPVATKVTVANLREMRKNLGIFGLDPSEVVYAVSSDIYYDLLDDPVFQTMNQVGVAATLLTGQIGQIGNSPVVVSGEFATKGVGAIGAIALNTANFIAGNQRGLRFDTQQLAESQKMVLVSSLRTGLTQLTSNQGQGVSKLTWAA